jgi:hypothetical protein
MSNQITEQEQQVLEMENAFKNTAYESLNIIVKALKNTPVQNPLAWVYIWQIIFGVFEDIVNPSKTAPKYPTYAVVNDDYLKTAWNKLWDNPWGGEDKTDKDVIEWMINNGLIKYVDPQM